MISIEPDKMDVESFCNAIGCTIKEFNKRVKEAKWIFRLFRVKYTKEDCIRYAKDSFFVDKMADISIKELQELGELATNTPDCVCKNIGWELPSNSPEYKKR